MINLLPDTMRQDIKAARSNVILLRYNILTISAAIGLLLVCLLFFFILSANQSNAVNQNNENELKAAAYGPTKQAAEEYKANLATAKTILDRNVEYTSTIFEIVKLLPQGVILDGISLKAGDFGKQTSFSASAKTIEQATQLKENFQNSKMFTNVHFQSVNSANAANSTDGAAASTSYPVQVVLNVQLNKVVAE